METKLLKFLIQLFAEEGEGTPTEDNNDPVESEDNTENVDEDDDDDVDFEDNSDDEDKSKEVKPKNTGKQNAQNAQKRLALKEKRERELNEAKNKAYLEGLKEGVGDVNPWTNEKIEDETDIEILKEMKEMEKKGLDPVEDYAKYHAQKLKEQRRAENEVKQKELARKESLKTEITDFDKKYGKGTAEKFLSDENFKNSKYVNYLGRLSLDEVYDLYTSTQAETNAKAEQIAIEKEAIKLSSTGTPGNKSTANSSFLKDIMSDDKKFREFQANLLNKY